jgi:hypothetical protein
LGHQIGATLIAMTTRNAFWLPLLLLLTLALAACNGAPKPDAKTETPTPTPTPTDETPSDLPANPPGDVQEPGEANPTNTPVGEVPAAQPVDAPMATFEVPDGTPMDTDQEQALALLNYMETQADAPRWVLTWKAGGGQIDLDAATGIMRRLLPDGTTHKFIDINKDVVKAVADGKHTWGEK